MPERMTISSLVAQLVNQYEPDDLVLIGMSHYADGGPSPVAAFGSIGTTTLDGQQAAILWPGDVVDDDGANFGDEEDDEDNLDNDQED